MIQNYIEFNLNQGEPEFGDYVICKERYSGSDTNFKELLHFIETNVGKILFLSYDEIDYYVAYDNTPEYIHNYFKSQNSTRRMERKEILYFSKNKEELEKVLKMIKYKLK